MRCTVYIFYCFTTIATVWRCVDSWSWRNPNQDTEKRQRELNPNLPMAGVTGPLSQPNTNRLVDVTIREYRLYVLTAVVKFAFLFFNCHLWDSNSRPLFLGLCALTAKLVGLQYFSGTMTKLSNLYLNTVLSRVGHVYRILKMIRREGVWAYVWTSLKGRV